MAREASRKNVDGFDSREVDLGYVAVVRHSGEVAFENLRRRVVPFAMPRDGRSGYGGDREVETAVTGEERTYLHSWRPSRYVERRLLASSESRAVISMALTRRPTDAPAKSPRRSQKSHVTLLSVRRAKRGSD